MQLNFRLAKENDLSELVHLLADDELGKTREDTSNPLNKKYLNIFKSIQSDTNNELFVVAYGEKLIGMLQLTYIPYLTHTGTWRCLIEGVRIHREYRKEGFGSAMFKWAINRAQEKGCELIQLTSNKQRPNAIKFYKDLGFKATHEGFKLSLRNNSKAPAL